MSSVDRNLHPVTTGAAAVLAAAHAADQPLKLYGSWFCPFVQRAWIVLAEKRNVPYQYVEVSPYKKTPEMLAMSPRGLVPYLAVPPATAVDAAPALHRRPLYESSVLCSYLDEAYSDAARHGPRLVPQAGEDDGRGGVVDAYERARCQLWIDHVSSRVVPAVYRLMQQAPESGSGLDEARARLLDHLRAFAQEMLDSDRGDDDDHGPWFLGRRFSMVDVMLAPWACRLFLIDHYKPGGTGIPPKREGPPPAAQGARGGGGDEDARVWARWHAWFEAIVERESVKQTWSDADRYIEAYKRYADNKTQSEVGQATRSGLPLP